MIRLQMSNQQNLTKDAIEIIYVCFLSYIKDFQVCANPLYSALQSHNNVVPSSSLNT